LETLVIFVVRDDLCISGVSASLERLPNAIRMRCFATARLIPTFRISSATDTPSSACFSTATICSTENRFFFMQNLPSDFAED
jgi:hypothetical protein